MARYVSIKTLAMKKNFIGYREDSSIGYISKRNDGMTELRINGFTQVRDILETLLPYIQFQEDSSAMLSSELVIFFEDKLSKC